MRIHVVQKGETFETIAKAYDLSVDELANMNRHLDQTHTLLPQMKIKVPMNVKKSPMASVGGHNQRQQRIAVNDKRLVPPHDPNKPKVLPRVVEDEYVVSDKLISAIDDDQENEFIQQFLPDGYHSWESSNYSQPPIYDYHFPIQVMEPITYDNQDVRNNPYYNYNLNGFAYQQAYYHPYYPQYNYMYRPYNPCGCGGYYY